MGEGIVHGVTSSSEIKSTKLGPAIYLGVFVNGVKVSALIDTGSPVTLLSLKQAVKILAEQKKDYETPQDWKRAMLTQFQVPSVSLKSYSGDPLNVIAQLPLTLKQGGCEVSAIVLIQKDAPNDFLIGTDLQSALGFSLIVKTSATQETMLLGGNLSLGVIEESPGSDSGVVHLLTAAKIPAGHLKLIKARAGEWLSRGLALFTPTITDSELGVADAMVQVDSDQCFTLIMENHGHCHVELEKDMLLGALENAEQIGGPEQLMSRALVSAVSSTPYPREKLLLEQIDLQVDHLSVEQKSHLIQLIVKYSDIFALGPHEVGTTGLVKHVIDTGNHPPVRQPVCHTPFALRNKVDEMVQDMLTQEVIQPSQSPWASPIVLVKKKDGGLRFCVDYHQLNRVTKLDVFPLPCIDDTLDLLSGAKYFTTLDLASGYWQVCMDPASQEKTAFITYSGIYMSSKRCLLV